MELARINGNKIPQEIFAEKPLKVAVIKRTHATVATKAIKPSFIESVSDDLPDFSSHEEPDMKVHETHQELIDPESLETLSIDDFSTNLNESDDIVYYSLVPKSEQEETKKPKRKFSILSLFKKRKEQLDAPYQWDNIFRLLK